jgi:uncharacterized membrane protein
MGLPGVSLTSAVLVLVNILAINVSALVLFWLSGFRPSESSAVHLARKQVASHVLILFISILILSTVLGLVTYASFQTAHMEEQVKVEVSKMLKESEYEKMRLAKESINVNYKPADMILGEPARVTLTMYSRVGQKIPPGIANRIDEHLTKVTGREIRIRVWFVEAQQSN